MLKKNTYFVKPIPTIMKQFFASKKLSDFEFDYPDNKGFSWHAISGQKRKTSEEIVSKSF